MKFLAVVTRTRQLDKPRVKIALLFCAEVKLDFVTKNSLANLIFDFVFSNTYLTTVSKYGRTNNIKNSWSKNDFLSASLLFMDCHKLGVFKRNLPLKSESMTNIAERIYFYLQKIMTLSSDLL